GYADGTVRYSCLQWSNGQNYEGAAPARSQECLHSPKQTFQPRECQSSPDGSRFYSQHLWPVRSLHPRQELAQSFGEEYGLYGYSPRLAKFPLRRGHFAEL